MTFKDFSKKIEEELETGDPIRFIVSNSTMSALLSENNNLDVNESVITMIQENVKLHLYIPNSHHDILWIVDEYKDLYKRSTAEYKAINRGLRTVTL